MSIGTEVIKDALKKIGAHSIAAPAAPETIIEGRDVLNSMIQQWETQGIKLGVVPLDAPGDELSEPLDSRNAIVNNLAVEMAPFFDNGQNVVSPSLAANAQRTFNIIKDTYQEFTVSNKIPSSTLPVGAGNRRNRNRRVFFGKNVTLGS